VQTGLGEAAINPGLVFSEIDSVIPDVVWASRDRLETMLDEAGHLIAAPELVVEILSPGEKNEHRDGQRPVPWDHRQAKLKIYSTYGVMEYWIADQQQRKVEVYRREGGLLKLALSLYAQDTLTSHVLPGFSVPVQHLF
jgi:Uma2 family endonuclease